METEYCGNVYIAGEHEDNESLHKLCNGIADQIRAGPRPVYSGYTTVLFDRVPSGLRRNQVG